MNRRNITQEEFNKLKSLAEELAYSPTKADGKQTLHKLEFYISRLRGQLFGDFNNTLGKLAAYAKSASGQVRDKAHWIDAMEEKLYILESKIAVGKMKITSMNTPPSINQIYPDIVLFKIGGYMGPSYSVEWKEGSLFYRAYDDGYSLINEEQLFPNPVKWRNFFKKMDTLGVWCWESEYTPDFDICDGTGWELTLQIQDKKVISTGVNSYPNSFDDFIKAIWNLIGRRQIG